MGQGRALCSVNHDALRTQSAVIQILSVGVLQCLGDVANQLKSLVNGEFGSTVSQ